MLCDCVYTVSAFTYLLVYNWVLVLYEAQRNLDSSIIWRWGVLHNKRLTKVEKEIEWNFSILH